MTHIRMLLLLALAAAFLAGKAPASPPNTVAPLAEVPAGNVDNGQIISSDARLRRTSPRRQTRPAANPLWAIPLSALSETRARPLFSPSRRPPPLAAHMQHRQTDRMPPRPAPPERPPLKLVGTIVGEATGFGLFIDTSSRATVRLKTGAAYRGWVLRTVRERSVVLEKNHLNQTLALPAPAAAHLQPVAISRPSAMPYHDPTDGAAVYH